MIESTNYILYVKSYVKEIDFYKMEEINKKLERGEYTGFKNMKIVYDNEHLDIEADDYLSTYEDAEKFVRDLSEVIVDGYLDIYFTSYNIEENFGYRIYPNRIRELRWECGEI